MINPVHPPQLFLSAVCTPWDPPPPHCQRPPQLCHPGPHELLVPSASVLGPELRALFLTSPSASSSHSPFLWVKVLIDDPQTLRGPRDSSRCAPEQKFSQYFLDLSNLEDFHSSAKPWWIKLLVLSMNQGTDLKLYQTLLNPSPQLFFFFL